MRRSTPPRPAGPGATEHRPASSAKRVDQEVELKLRLRAQDLALVRARLDALGATRTGHTDSTYYDTPERKLAQSRAALRLRCVRQGPSRRWVQTFKTGDCEQALSRRGEWESPAPGGRIDPERLAASPLAQLLERRAGRGPGSKALQLQPVFQTVFERSSWDLTIDGARIEASIDVGEIRAGGRVEPICELELELRSGPPAAIVELALDLAGISGPRRRADLSLLPYGASKAARGYLLAQGGERSATDGRACAVKGFAAGQSAAAAARRLCAMAMNAVLANAEGFCARDDPEFVHQARVSLRRMRSGLDLLGEDSGFPPRLRAQMRRWAACFGAVRDWDVLCEQVLPDLAGRAPRGCAPAWRRVAIAAQRRRSAAGKRLRGQIDTPEFADFALRMLRFTTGDPAQREGALDAAAAKVLRNGQRQLASAARSFAKASGERQHKLRILAKTLRYGLEMLPDALPEGARARTLRALTRFQDASGSVCDAALAARMVRRLTRSLALREQLRDWVRLRQRKCSAKAQRLAPDLRPRS